MIERDELEVQESLNPPATPDYPPAVKDLHKFRKADLQKLLVEMQGNAAEQKKAEAEAYQEVTRQRAVQELEELQAKAQQDDHESPRWTLTEWVWSYLTKSDKDAEGSARVESEEAKVPDIEHSEVKGEEAISKGLQIDEAEMEDDLATATLDSNLGKRMAMEAAIHILEVEFVWGMLGQPLQLIEIPKIFHAICHDQILDRSCAPPASGMGERFDYHEHIRVELMMAHRMKKRWKSDHLMGECEGVQRPMWIFDKGLENLVYRLNYNGTDAAKWSRKLLTAWNMAAAAEDTLEKVYYIFREMREIDGCLAKPEIGEMRDWWQYIY
jgi:hypothetical protein